MTLRDRVLGGLWGSLVGDALGVPVEFQDRSKLQAAPVTDLRGFGTHHQPPGTWSDDGALLLCTADSLLNAGFDTQDIGLRFVRWLQDGLWTARGDVFDVGLTTQRALKRIQGQVAPEQAGGQGEFDNGNGSLMRILPVALRFACGDTSELLDKVARASAITHGHACSKMACGLHALIVRFLLDGAEPTQAIQSARAEFAQIRTGVPELSRFKRLLIDDFRVVPEANVVSTGYVLDTLHAALWSVHNTSSFEDCVLRAVNLGGDTDTTGCVAGGLAGVHYGMEAIPEHWRRALPRGPEVAMLFDRFADLVDRAQITK